MSIQHYTSSFTELVDQIDTTQLPTAANGQILIGNGKTMSLAPLTPGTGISVSAGIGTLTVTCTVVPGDLTGAVQFNLDGTFTGDVAHFSWDAQNHRLGLGTSTPHATLDNQGSRRSKRFLVTTQQYVVGDTDFYLGVKYPNGVCTITLPPSNTGDGGTREIWVGDESGYGSNPGIAVEPLPGETINGLDVTHPFTFNTANGLAVFRSNGSGGWFATLCAVSTGVTSVGINMPSTVFSILASPVTSAGVLNVGFVVQAAGTVFAGPTGGTPNFPTFRALIAADIPSIPASKINSGLLGTANGGTGLDTSAAANGQLLIGNGSGFTLNTLTAGANITITNAGGAITIASAASAPGTEPANTVYAGPTSGSAAIPTFRALVAADIPALPASQITTGQLGVARGGTGLDASTAANGQLLIGNGTGFTLATLTAGANVTITNTAGGITIAAATTGGSGSAAAGATGAVQFNSAGSLAGDAAHLFWDATNNRLGIGTGTPNATLDNQGSCRIKRTAVTGATATIGATDHYVGVNYNGAVTLTLPTALTSDNGSRVLLICDEGGYAATHNITINAYGSEGINNVSSFVLSVARGMVVLYNDGNGDWFATVWTPSAPVTSAGLSLPADFTVTGSPVTSTGTLTATYANQSANTVFAGPSTGSASAPSFRGLVAADIPGLTASKIIAGQLPAALGGTGLDGSGAANGQLLIGNGTGYTLANVMTSQGLAVTNGAGSITLTKSPLFTATYGSTTTFNLSQSDLQIVTLLGNPTLALSNVTAGLPFTLILQQDGTGSRTITSWFSGLSWGALGTPTLTTTPGKKDIFTFLCTSAGNYLGFVAGQGY